MFDREAPRVHPAPTSSPNLAGKYYVARGSGQFVEYLLASGSWGKPCYYFRDQAAAERALAEREGTSLTDTILTANIAADSTFARDTKKLFR